MYIMKIYTILSKSCCGTYMKFQLNTHDRLVTILKIRILSIVVDGSEPTKIDETISKFL